MAEADVLAMVKALAPELSSVPDATLYEYIEQGYIQHDAGTWGSLRDMIVSRWVAVMASLGATAAGGAGTGSATAVSMQKQGNTQLGFQASGRIPFGPYPPNWFLDKPYGFLYYQLWHSRRGITASNSRILRRR